MFSMENSCCSEKFGNDLTMSCGRFGETASDDGCFWCVGVRDLIGMPSKRMSVDADSVKKSRRISLF